MTTLAGDRTRQIELACFAALAFAAALRWTALVADPPSAQVTVAVVGATAAGAALAAIGGLRASRSMRWLLVGAVTVAAVVLGLLLVGMPARLLLPVHWGELGSNVGRSLDGLAEVPVPYEGADPWTRLVIVVVAPVVVGLAALAAFWPTRRRAAGRTWALVLLVGLYLFALAWARPDQQLASGALLLALACAWLWLPRLEARRRVAALVAVACAGAVAVPAAALVEPGRSLIDYRHWNLFSTEGTSFRWEQSYGPLVWPQRGTLLLEVASDRSHYWKATNLDSFDGVRWERSLITGEEPALGQPREFVPEGIAPRHSEPDWVDRINFRVRQLTSDVALGAGTILDIDRIEASPAQDAIWKTDEDLGPGDTYTALVYDPKPSSAEMRAAGAAYPAEARRYTTFAVPGRSETVSPGFWRGSAGPALRGEMEGTPYEGMYGLARRITDGAPTPYDAITRIEGYLRSAYDYRQDVPRHDYPLPAFLSQDRAGYCQQFSGAMALMLRMLGIPSRVAAGFSAGGRAPGDSFLVQDIDAHNWVEAFLPGIGWVTFEPTPAAAPANTQLNDALGETDLSFPNQSSPIDLSDQTDPNAPQRNPQPAEAAAAGDAGGSTALTISGTVAAALALVAAVIYVGRRARTRRLDARELAEAQLRELESALARLGGPLPPGSTLLRVERSLARLAGHPAAAYAAELRERRYRDPDLPPPTMAERRSLRRALLRAAGGRALITLLRAMPPGGPSSRRRGRADPTTSR